MIKRTPQDEEEYRKAIETIQRLGPYFLMRREPETGEWYTLFPRQPIYGLTEAQDALEEYKAKHSDVTPSNLRVIPAVEAQSIRETWNVAQQWMTKNSIPHPPLHGEHQDIAC
jgi:hypothetical protein